MVGVSPEPWLGDELNQTAQESFDSHIGAVASSQHSVQIWFFEHGGFPPKSFMNAANGPKFCPTCVIYMLIYQA